MAVEAAKYIWMNGKLVPWEQATMHVMTHGFLYGTSAFEGLRSYDTKHQGVCLFRNKEHMQRLLFSARVYHIPIDYTLEEIMAAARETVRENGLVSSYIRVNAYLGYGELGPSSLFKKGDFNIIAFNFGKYLGADAMEKGIDVAVSSWRRSAPGTIPAGVKAAGNYLSSRLITMEAKQRGCSEGIGLSHDGNVSEGAGENLFLVRNNKILTPPAASSILNGITRDAVMTLAREHGYSVEEAVIPRELLYGADELFFTGNAAEITKIRTVDGIAIGSGNTPVISSLQKAFFGLFTGETEDKWGWLDPVA